jgi:hypothetical protein
VQPAGFHLSPGIDRHQSWIEFPVPEPDATDFILCFDGQIMSTGVGETPAGGSVLVSVHTEWVDLEWLLGQLAGDSSTSRWELRYTLYRLHTPLLDNRRNPIST